MRPEGAQPEPVAIVLPHLPDRPRSGQDLRHHALVRALGQLGEVHVFGLCHRPDPGSPPWPGVATWACSSDPALSAAHFTTVGHEWMAREDGHPSDHWFDARAARELSSFLAAIGPASVVLGGLDLHGYLPSVRAAGAVVALDAPNVEADVAAQNAELAAAPQAVLVRRLVAERTARLEERVTSAVDQVWVCSDHDADRVRARYPDAAPTVVIPNVIDREPLDGASRRDGAGDPHLLFPGSLRYPPNADAATWLVDEIFPAVRTALPGARLSLVGADPGPDLRARARDDPAAIEVPGLVDDTAPWFARATVVPVPLRAGAGTRLKILEAFALGVPVVSTPKGHEGLAVTAGVHLRSAATTDDLVAAIVELHTDPMQARALAHRGRELVERRYSLAALIDALGDVVAAPRHQ
jgi:glycosyltransferase involved in cell wall biosynthesis